MAIVIIILIIGGYIYFKGISEPAELKKLIQGRPQQQQDVIKYFFGKGGFLTKRITDAEYDNIVVNSIKELIKKAEEISSSVEMISTETEEGMSFFHLSGIGAILRYAANV